MQVRSKTHRLEPLGFSANQGLAQASTLGQESRRVGNGFHLRAPLARAQFPAQVAQTSPESAQPSYLLKLGKGRFKGIGIQHIERALPKGTTLADWPGLHHDPTTGMLTVCYEREFARGLLLRALSAPLGDDDAAWQELVDADYLFAEKLQRKEMVRAWQEATHGLPPCEFRIPGAEWFKHDATRSEYSRLLRSVMGHGSFVIGEHHDRKTSMRLLLDNLPELAQAGFKTIYLEGLSIHLQEAVDAYLAHGSTDHLSPSHRSCINTLHPQTRQLLYQAPQLGLRVVGLDHHAARNGGVPCKGRLASMNHSAVHVIDADLTGERDLFVVCVGLLHARQATDPFDHTTVKGIAQLLGVPSVLVTESGEGNPDRFCAGSQAEARNSPMQTLKESVYLDDGVRDEFKGDGWDYYVRSSSGASLRMVPLSDQEPSYTAEDEKCSIQ